MKKITLILLPGLITIVPALGQLAMPPAYRIISDTATKMILLPDSCWQMIADPSGNLTLQEVLQSREFQTAGHKIDYDINTYWLRYQLVNRMAKEAQITFWCTDIPYSSLYAKTDGEDWQTYKSGYMLPYSKRDGLKSLNAVTLTVPAGGYLVVYQKNTYYNYLASYYQQNPVAEFSFSKWVVQRQQAKYTRSVLLSFVLGLFLLTLVINLYFFIIVREKEFLFFTLFLLSFGVGWALGLDDILLKEHPAISFYLTMFFYPFVDFFLIHSVRHFLKTFTRFPRWDSYLISISIIGIIAAFSIDFAPAVVHSNTGSIFTLIYGLIVLLAYLSLLFTAYLYRGTKDKIARLVVYAFAPYGIIISERIVFDLLNRFGFFKNGGSLVSWYSSVHAGLSDYFLYPASLAWMSILFAGVLFIRFSILRRKYAQEKLEREQERNAMIEQENTRLEVQVAERTSELKHSLEELKSTQSQLIQSEKMASLGELTAGIAHEIQNPLNFVNNFSDINKELLDEMKSEILSDNKEEAISIANDIKANEEKINHHGKRADAIVKGMLQHSRTATGVKESTDINTLADEYLRLSYHGMRARDKSFNCSIETHFDESLQKINVVPQDIGRVLLNLFNNAFYACAEHSRSTAAGHPLSGVAEEMPPPYKPIVSLTTKKSLNHISITVTDNGNGIPEKIKDKIFQPFFTTKPTGQGTGLGLSLSYDIITKEHNGTIKVASQEGEGTAFTVTLPDDTPVLGREGKQ